MHDIWRYKQRVSKAWLVRHCMPTPADCSVIPEWITTGSLLADCKEGSDSSCVPMASQPNQMTLQHRRDWCHSQYYHVWEGWQSDALTSALARTCINWQEGDATQCNVELASSWDVPAMQRRAL